MFHFTLLSIGKTKERWLAEAMSEYMQRMKTHTTIRLELYKNNTSLLKAAEKHPNILALDPQGPLFSSETFASYLLKKLESGGTRLAFLIGGPEGLPPSIRENTPLISLSPMTFTHQMARLLLIEQLYRAWTINENLPYHKG